MPSRHRDDGSSRNLRGEIPGEGGKVLLRPGGLRQSDAVGEFPSGSLLSLTAVLSRSML